MSHRRLVLLPLLWCLALPTAAHAILIEVGAEAWNVETIGANVVYGDEELIRSQPWWGNPDRADAFADAVRDGLGLGPYPVTGQCGAVCLGPLFAYAFEGLGPDDPLVTRREGAVCPYLGCTIHSDAVLASASAHDLDGAFVDIMTIGTQPTWHVGWYAVATSVPEPGTFALLLGGGLLLGFVRRRTRC